jgi:hypothetical protein
VTLPYLLSIVSFSEKCSGRILQDNFAGDAPGACPEPVEGTGAESIFKDFPGDLLCAAPLPLLTRDTEVPGSQISLGTRLAPVACYEHDVYDVNVPIMVQIIGRVISLITDLAVPSAGHQHDVTDIHPSRRLEVITGRCRRRYRCRLGGSTKEIVTLAEDPRPSTGNAYERYLRATLWQRRHHLEADGGNGEDPTSLPPDDGLGELDGPFGIRGGIHSVEAWKVAWLNLRGRIACGINHLKERWIEADQESHRIESHPISVQGDMEYDDVPNLGVRGTCGIETHGGAALLKR